MEEDTASACGDRPVSGSAPSFDILSFWSSAPQEGGKGKEREGRGISSKISKPEIPGKKKKERSEQSVRPQRLGLVYNFSLRSSLFSFLFSSPSSTIAKKKKKGGKKKRMIAR